MKTPEQITDLAALAGKTIARAVPMGNRLGLVFDDRSFVILGIDRGYEPGDEELDLQDTADFETRDRLGLVEPEERRQEIQSREDEARWLREFREAREREEYERLRRKFEDR